MYNFSNSYFYSDLDGTLLDNNALLSTETYTGLKHLIQQGMLFGVASARNLITISEIFKGIQLSLPVICLNGAYISDLATMKHLQINDIDTTSKHEILELLHKMNLGVFISNHYNTIDSIDYIGLKNEGEFWYLRDRECSKNQIITPVNNITDVLKRQITCFTIINKIAILEDLKKIIEEKFYATTEIHLFENQYSPEWAWLTIHSHMATKSNAISYIKRNYNLSDKALMVFGDGLNDLKMFDIADVSIAVKNAHPILKKKANQLISENSDHAVIKYLTRVSKSTTPIL
ncbi:HAD-IIB family hydrolase [Aquimarina aquimarini]|uniref:HAD-IIB family hydrolase n=1 Tax=Aquimarina aquimarini TaxID=1191734 RepID=UPI000D54DBCB|nr:HAD-IIB family hydrolase [Aquimarina aquimarini]